MSLLTTSKAWTALQSHYNQSKNDSLRDAFKKDPNRFNKLSINDFSLTITLSIRL